MRLFSLEKKVNFVPSST